MGKIVAIIAAIGLAAFGVARGTWAVGGSDSSCYGLMAKAMAGGHLQPSSPLVTEAPWPNAPITFAPGGFIPSTLHPDAAAPICAPGMSVLMAPLAMLFGQDAIFWLTPIAAAMLVLSAFVIAWQVASTPIAGVMAAVLTATSPIVLYQSVQPMNDIVTAALWLAAIACATRFALAGVLIGLAILVRPNLAPVAIVLAVIPFIHHRDFTARLRALAMMIAGALPGVLVMLWLNDALYGSPVGSGYGAASQLFSASHISANLANYSRALFETQNVIPALGLLAPFIFEGKKRQGVFMLLAVAAVVAGIYLLYEPFPEWWYLRFLIPAIVILLVLASAVTTNLLSRAKMGGLIPLVAVVVGIIGVRTAVKHDVLTLQTMEGRYRETSKLIHDRLPANAVVITEFQSGSVRFHAGREVVLWQSLDPPWLDRAVTWLKSKGLQPYILVERREEPLFRSRFRSQSEVGGLDWPPRFDFNRQVRIYDPDDRARYYGGQEYTTENIGVSRRSPGGGGSQR